MNTLESAIAYLQGGATAFRHTPPHLIRAMLEPNVHAQEFCNNFLGLHVGFQTGRIRIDSVQPQPSGDLADPPQNTFQLLFKDDNKRAELRRIVYDAFRKYLVVDPTNIGTGTLRLKLSSVEPPSPEVERGLHSEALAFHSAAEPIDLYSDGVKSFTGLMAEVIGGDPGILIIDEPEAFLHPALASLLGREISRATARSRKRLFA